MRGSHSQIGSSEYLVTDPFEIHPDPLVTESDHLEPELGAFRRPEFVGQAALVLLAVEFHD